MLVCFRAGEPVYVRRTRTARAKPAELSPASRSAWRTSYRAARGGADYIVWKIERHSGEKIVLSPWQRRHPLLAAPLLLPRLLRRGAIR